LHTLFFAYSNDWEASLTHNQHQETGPFLAKNQLVSDKILKLKKV
jgi:hypothetical protein